MSNVNRLGLKKAKEKLKELAKEIRKLRATRKQQPFGYVPDLSDLSCEARHRHIAYSLVRGRKMEEIERTCKNPPSQRTIDFYKEEIANEGVKNEEVKETVCPSVEPPVKIPTNGSVLSRCCRVLFGSWWKSMEKRNLSST
jgi:hypothetical protein